MASHDGKRRSHQRFLRNLPKQKPGKYLKVIQSSVADPGKYLKVILSSVADPDLALRKGGGGWGRFSVAWTAGFSSLCDSFFFFFFFTQNKEGRSGLDPPGLFPRSATALARVGLIAAYLLFWAGLFEKGLTLILV